jgi:cellulase/cellobiase CelA1
MRLRTISLAAAGLLTVAGSLALVLPAASAASAGCRVEYKISSQWTGGFQGDVAITNLGDPLSTWTLGFDFPDAAQKLTQGWSATWTQSAAHVTAASLGWNGNLGTGATVGVGFTGAWSGSNPVPTAFTLNGIPCTVV